MTKRSQKKRPTAQQQAAVADLRALADEHPGKVVAVEELGTDDLEQLSVRVRITTHEMPVSEGGMPLEPEEDVIVQFPEHYPLSPPRTVVDHGRFLGCPHVLLGHRLCIYLDETREWHPAFGVRDFMNRLDQWFVDAAAGNFDASTALYHAVGGVAHHTPGTPTIVVRQMPESDGKSFVWVGLRKRTDKRLDLVLNGHKDADCAPALLIRPIGALALGAGITVDGLLISIARTGHPEPDSVRAKLGQAAKRTGTDQRVYFVLAVPGPTSSTGTASEHLLAGRLPLPDSTRLRLAASSAGPAFIPTESSLPADTPVEWCAVSDERPAVTNRRDSKRPVAAFAGRAVEVWGCGALGSWIAEFVVRAGAERVVLRDFGQVTGGLLVRQNYGEADVGQTKVEALAARLHAISDGVVVEAHQGHALLGVIDNRMPECDLIIDATVSTTVAVLLDQVRKQSDRPPLVARVSTDTPTSTLALVTVCARDSQTGPVDLDEAARKAATADTSLERFTVFWEDMDSQALVPAPGCSIPTFHGSAADAAAVASVIVSLIGPHLEDGTMSGTHFAALPIAAGDGPAHTWVEHRPS